MVQALYHAGANAMVLISKADLFSAADRKQMISYVKSNLHDQLGVTPPVHAVSVFGTDAALCDRWFESELRPFLARHRQLAIILQKRKIGGFRKSVIGALERRLQSEAVPAGTDALSDENREALRESDRLLERAQGESFFLTRRIAKIHQAIIDVAAERIAAGLIESGDADAAGIFSETVASLIAEPVVATLRLIEQTRDALAKAMQAVASRCGTGTPDELPKPAGMPMLDVNEISKTIVIEKPTVISLFGKGVLASHVRRKLEQQYDRALLEFLSLYANRLRRWMEQSINALRNAFNAFADMHRAYFETASLAAGVFDKSAIQNDLRVLREWGSADAAAAVGD